MKFQISNFKFQISNRKIDVIAYLILFGVFLLGAFAVYGLQGDGRAQLNIILALAAFYLIWGLIFHHIKSDLDKWLLFEYLAIAAISVACGVLVFVS